ncbi:DUF2007 domain-containing protein [bacterium]|nr:MAG: DUF2007 domain-containing protein [bacterium]
MTHPEYRQVYVTTGDFMAGSIVALLKSFGIDAYFNQDTSEIAGPLGTARIFVPASQCQDAVQILAQMEGGKLESSPWDQYAELANEEKEGDIDQ